MGSDRPRLSETNEHPSRRRRGRRDMARGAPRIEPEWQRPCARDGPARHGRRVDQHVQRHERRAEIMPRDGAGTSRARRAGSVEHGGDVRYRYAEWRRWAEWKAREDYDGPLPWSALDRDGRVRRIAAVAAETMPKQHVGRIVEACAKASRSEDEFIRRVRREGFSIDRVCARARPGIRSIRRTRWSDTGSPGAAGTAGRNGSTRLISVRT